MGYKLYREIIEFAPWDWTRGERWVAAVIADDANDRTRRSWIPLDELCIRTGYKPIGIRRIMQRLARRGFEFRIGMSTGSDGREVFATRGHRTEYSVPRMPKGGTRVPPLPFPLPVDNPEKGGTHVPVNNQKGGTEVPPSAQKGGTDGAERRYAGTAHPLSPLRSPVTEVDGPVEVSSAGPAEIHRRTALRADSPPGSAVDVDDRRPAGMTRLEWAAHQAAQSRHRRELGGLTSGRPPGGNEQGSDSRFAKDEQEVPQ